MEWIRIKDNNKLPKINTPVMICTSYKKTAVVTLSIEENKAVWIDYMRAYHSYGSVTHWCYFDLPED